MEGSNQWDMNEPWKWTVFWTNWIMYAFEIFYYADSKSTTILSSCLRWSQVCFLCYTSIFDSVWCECEIESGWGFVCLSQRDSIHVGFRTWRWYCTGQSDRSYYLFIDMKSEYEHDGMGKKRDPRCDQLSQSISQLSNQFLFVGTNQQLIRRISKTTQSGL